MLASIEGIGEEELQLGHFFARNASAAIKRIQSLGDVVAVEFEVACRFGVDRGDVAE